MTGKKIWQAFFNPDSPRPAGWLDFVRWKLTGRPQVSPCFVSDVEQSIPPKRVEGGALKITMVKHNCDSGARSIPVGRQR